LQEGEMKASDDPYVTATDQGQVVSAPGWAPLAVRIPWCLSWIAVALLSLQVFVSPIIYQSRLATGAYITTEIGAGVLGAIGAVGVLVIRLVRSGGSPDPFTRRLAWSILRGLLVVIFILTGLEVA
jgi:hypothetical protein